MLNDAQKERVARNEAAFRAENENFLAGRPDRARGYAALLCECGNADCYDEVRVSLDAYEQVRANPRRFLIAPDHLVPEVEDVVARDLGHWVVEKHPEVAEIVEESDPRS